MSIEFEGWTVLCDGAGCRKAETHYGEIGDDWDDICDGLERSGWRAEPDDFSRNVFCPQCVTQRAEAERLRASGLMVAPDGAVLDEPLIEAM